MDTVSTIRSELKAALELTRDPVEILDSAFRYVYWRNGQAIEAHGREGNKELIAGSQALMLLSAAQVQVEQAKRVASVKGMHYDTTLS